MFAKPFGRSRVRFTAARLWVGVMVLLPIVFAACNQNGGGGY